MSLRTLLFIIVLVGSFTLFSFNIRRLISYLKVGQPENRSGDLKERIKNVALIAFCQKKLFRDPAAGVMHFLIFWGFIVLLLAIVELIGEGIFPGFSLAFTGSFYPVLVFFQELFGLLVVCSVLFALFRRYIYTPKRLDTGGHARMDAAFILFLILTVMASMFFQNAAGIASGRGVSANARFISNSLSGIFSSAEKERIEFFYNFFWWIHIAVVLGFMNYLPYSKHLHILSSIPNVFLSKLVNRGSVRPLNLSDEAATKFGASDVGDFSWKGLLDGYTCTECGRCTAVCPANVTGKPLSPKKIIVDIRRRLMEMAPLIVKSRRSTADRRIISETEDQKIGTDEETGKYFIDNYITEEELWACTTCMGCLQECPVQIEHIDPIIEMRRYLVLNESRFPKELQTVFQNLERNFTPWAFSHSARADWADGLGVPVMAEKGGADVLFWVGCAGSYDERYIKVSRALAKIMQLAGTDFAILGSEEKCSGDPARRAGNEYLAQMLMTENIATMRKYRFKKIVTACPHCYNIIKNEYRQFGGNYEVVHHTEYMIGLIRSGKLKIGDKKQERIVYHDSCYLGRYNSIYDPPREVLSSINGSRMIEMKRKADRGFCCGAGGARMFMEENIGKRVNLERTEEALSLHPDVVGTACPFCMTMMTDGAKDKEAGGRVQVKDIAELVLEAVIEKE